MNFIETPNLPRAKVRLMIAGGLNFDELRELQLLGIKVLVPKCEPLLPKAIADHGDVVFHYFGCGQFVISDTQNELSETCCAAGMTEQGSVRLSGAYPGDSLLNCAVVGSSVLLNARTASEIIVDFYRQNRYNIVNVKQGYTKCATAVVADGAIITEDEGIYSAAKQNNIDALLIKAGYVALDGYDRGFIGGACGKISRSELLFNGDITVHPDFRNIKSFCNNYRVDLIPFSKKTLYDNGGFIPLAEE